MEAVITSKLTTKSQATIPGKIRKLLGLNPGDSVAFEIEQGQKVVIRKATPVDFEFAFAQRIAFSVTRSTLQPNRSSNMN